jgi:uncharacterized protein YcbK (DUF882 family)
MMQWSRRRLLKAGALVAGASAAGAWAQGASAQTLGRGGAQGRFVVKRLALQNLHTPESLDVEFFRDGTYVPEAVAAIQVLLRDYRTGEQHSIDPKLLDNLHELALAIGVDPVFGVISGYRSAQTNELLRERGSGVAPRSLHLAGRAIDVRLAGVDCADLADGAFRLRRGGVGYYRRSEFVHLDTGAFRTWRG